jgi:hypothetical protein
VLAVWLFLQGVEGVATRRVPLAVLAQ